MRDRHIAAHMLAGALWTTLETAGERLIQFGFFVLLSRLLGPEAWGLVGVALTLTLLGDVLFAEGPWADAIARDPDLDPVKLDTLFWLMLLTGLGLAALTVAVSFPAARLLGKPMLTLLTPALAPTLLLKAAAVLPAALLRREQRYAAFPARAVAANAAAGIGATAAAMAGAGLWSLVLLQLMQALVAMLVVFAASGWRPRWRFSTAGLGDTLGFVAGGAAERLIGLADGVLVRLLVAKLLGAAALGHFLLASKLVDFLNQALVRPIARVALPAAVRVGRDPAALQRMAEGALELAALVGFPAALAVAAAAPDLVPGLFGAHWEPSVGVLQLLVWVVAASSLTQLCSSFGYAARRVADQVKLALLRSGLLLGILLVTGVDLHGLALATALRAVLMVPIRLAGLRRFMALDGRRVAARLLRILAAALLMAAVMRAAAWALPAWPPLIRAAALLLVGGVAFAPAAALFAWPTLATAFRTLRAARLSILGRGLAGTVKKPHGSVDAASPAGPTV